MCDPRARLRLREAEAAQMTGDSYAAYLLASLRATSLWGLWQRWLTLIRRWRLLSTVLRWSVILLGWLETSAIFLLTVTVLLAAGLPLLLCGAVMLLLGLAQHHRCSRMLGHCLAGQQICVCIAQRGAFAPGSYFGGMVRALAARENCTVLIVSPYFWRSFGRPYVTLRRDGMRLFTLRRHYYFALRRRILLPNRAHVTIIY